jgi:hypothetical protein
VQFLEGAAGRIRASFECPAMNNGAAIGGADCGAQGFVAADNCELQ